MTETQALVSTRRRWVILAASLLAAMATACVVSGVAFLIPELHREAMTLSAASLLAAAPMVGLLCTTIPWGWALDRWGEREILLISLSITVVTTIATVVASATGRSFVVIGLLLAASGAAAASTNGASGRIVVGWFPPEQRGAAMGIRQTAQPLGVGVCAMTVPALAQSHGVTAGFVVFAVVAACALVATAAVITDPPGREPARVSTGESTVPAVPEKWNPYRANGFLVRIHAASVLLVIPQMVLWTFVPTWLIVDRGWPVASAGALVTVTQFLGAAGRIAAGRWSDVWGSRTKPIRVIAIAAAVLTAALALTDQLDLSLAIPLMVAASVVSVADNGLAFTAVAEFTGPSWSGRGLAVQNTAQWLMSAAAVPVIGATISALGYPIAFAIAAVAPIIAIGCVPIRTPDRVAPASH